MTMQNYLDAKYDLDGLPHFNINDTLLASIPSKGTGNSTINSTVPDVYGVGTDIYNPDAVVGSSSSFHISSTPAVSLHGFATAEGKALEGQQILGRTDPLNDQGCGTLFGRPSLVEIPNGEAGVSSTVKSNLIDELGRKYDIKIGSMDTYHDYLNGENLIVFRSANSGNICGAYSDRDGTLFAQTPTGRMIDDNYYQVRDAEQGVYDIFDIYGAKLLQNAPDTITESKYGSATLVRQMDTLPDGLRTYGYSNELSDGSILKVGMNKDMSQITMGKAGVNYDDMKDYLTDIPNNAGYADFFRNSQTGECAIIVKDGQTGNIVSFGKGKSFSEIISNPQDDVLTSMDSIYTNSQSPVQISDTLTGQNFSDMIHSAGFQDTLNSSNVSDVFAYGNSGVATEAGNLILNNTSLFNDTLTNVVPTATDAVQSASPSLGIFIVGAAAAITIYKGHKNRQNQHTL